jgi:putative aldouronate transport system permease protein
MATGTINANATANAHVNAADTGLKPRRRARRTRVKESVGDRILLTVCYVCVFLIVIVTLYPFWEIIITSISTRADALRTGLKLFTTNPDFSAYVQVLTATSIMRGFGNSVVRVVVGSLVSVILTALTAYPLSKPHFFGHKFFTVIILFTMVFGGGLIPGYLLITQTLKLTDTLWALVIPGAVGAYNLILVRNFLRSIPPSLEESARIDGASEMRVWWSIVLPLSKPVLATLTLWGAVGHWNAYFDALLYTRSESKMVLQVLLRRILVEQQMTASDLNMMLQMGQRPTEATTRAALIVVSTLPIVMVYPFLQKYFIKGIMLGSVKG